MRERCRCGRRRGVVEFHLSGAGSLRPPAGAGPLGRGGLGLIGKDREASYRRYRCLGSWRFTSHPVGAASSSCFGRWSPGNSRCPRAWDVTTGCFASWPCCWPKKAVALAEPPIPGAFLESPTRRGDYDGCDGQAHLFAFEAPDLLVSSYPLVIVHTAGPHAGLALWRLRRA
jgi:hypothetical protein